MRLILSAVAMSACLSGCTATKYAYHSAYTLRACGDTVSRQKLVTGLVQRGYLHSSDVRGPYDVFRKPEIIKKGVLAQEPYEDKSGQIAVAICAGDAEHYLITEEWQGCDGRKDCTAENQRDVRRMAETWGCQVAERSGHSESWKLENRQDWTEESCRRIADSLSF